jgi:hypothetical protein
MSTRSRFSSLIPVLVLVLILAPGPQAALASHGDGSVPALAQALERTAKSAFYDVWSAGHGPEHRPLVEQLDALVRDCGALNRVIAGSAGPSPAVNQAFGAVQQRIRTVDQMVGYAPFPPGPHSSILTGSFAHSWGEVHEVAAWLAAALSASPGPGPGSVGEVFRRYLSEYRRYLLAPSGSAEEADAQLRYKQYQRQFNEMRAAGAMLCTRTAEAFRAYLSAYERYLAAPSGSAEETVAKIEYPEYRRDFEKLKPVQPLFYDIREAFEAYVDEFERYLRAPSGSMAETIAKIAYQEFSGEYRRLVGSGQMMFHDVHVAFEAYARARAEYQAAPSGSTAEAIAKIRYTEYEREWRQLGGH